ncbi:MAG: 3-deoxy-8-phosphooctulonate synthase [Lentisphaeraceae bacterium]|nr:3-deoxy-8-phosphooctulonate synthase [Lentisphaeraceae bacterium]
MTEIQTFQIGSNVTIGPQQPLTLLAGPCVLESEEICNQIASTVQEICADLGVQYIFKASFDKANRTSVTSFRGPGLDHGLEKLQAIKDKFNVPVVSDIHETGQVEKAATVIDYLQIPAFLCRQTDLLIAAGESGKAVNVKKGQFLAPGDMLSVRDKLYSTGNKKISLCERGTTFGYNNLVVDMRGLQIMRELGCPVVFDATHSVQLPGGQGSKSGGQPQFIPTLSKAAVAAGIDGIFMEVHPEPAKALSDGANSLPLDKVREVLTDLVKIRKALGYEA